MPLPVSGFNRNTLILLIAVVICWLPAGAGSARESSAEATARTDARVAAELSSMYGVTPKIISHVDLTKAFHTKTPWALVAGKEPEREAADKNPFQEPGAVSLCFAHNGSVDCSEKVFADHMKQYISRDREERLFYELLISAIVYSGPGKTRPLLMLRTCTAHSVNGNCGVSTFLFDYDRKEDRFYDVFFNVTGRNNNEETRFIESGPLIGNIIVAYPTDNAPFTYWIEVYKRKGSSEFERSLRYRGKTVYGDGNSLAVIDSEMPETLRRLKLWARGQALPVPHDLPAGCKLIMRKGVEWCE
jgi:hypothetical protein